MNVFSIDVEDYFHVEAFSDVVSRDRWDQYPSRVEENTRRLLDLLGEFQVTATFFVLGWVAERSPALVRDIAAAGHEVASHSYWHRLIYDLSPEEFRKDTLRAKDAVEQATGRPVFGYRAPSFSIDRRCLWALSILAECGFRYDASIFPIHHDIYGMPDAPFAPFRVGTPAGEILEFPATTFRILGHRRWPVGGGGYLRILPFWYTRLGLKRAAGEGLPLIVYVHPWEADPDQPRLGGRLRSRLRHYTNLDKTCVRLRALLGGGGFSSFEESGLPAAIPREAVSL